MSEWAKATSKAGYSYPPLTCLCLGSEGGAWSDGKQPCGGKQTGNQWGSVG